MLRAGSPGRAFVREKVSMVIPSRRGMRRKSLLRMYVLMNASQKKRNPAVRF
jgi:hypothetical protein